MINILSKVRHTRESTSHFGYPLELQDGTVICYIEISLHGDEVVEAEIVTQRNDPRINRQWQIHLQS